MPSDPEYSEKIGAALKEATFEFGGLLKNELNIFLNEEDLTVSRKMQESIESVERLEGDTLEVLVGPTVHYAEYVHQGTKPHFPPVAELIDWVQKRGFASGERTPRERARLLAFHIAEEGTEPNPFLTRFNQQKGEQLSSEYREMLQKAIDRRN
jgi:hypothetical protein